MKSLPILTYHRVIDGEPTRERDPRRIAVSQAQFRSHLKWLKRFGIRTIALDDYAALLREGKSPPPRTVAITFDDGYEDVLANALAPLKESGFTAAVFAVTDEIGGRNRWDDGKERLMTAEGLREWRAAGMQVGAHSRRHKHLPQESDAAAREELRGSRECLEDLLKIRIALFAYPYGETDDRVDALTREAGFEAAFATDRAPADHAANLFRLRRAVVFPKNTPWEILMKSQRWYPVYQDWKR